MMSQWVLHPTFISKALKEGKLIGQALPASPGAAVGKVYFSAEEAKNHHEAGKRVILVRLIGSHLSGDSENAGICGEHGGDPASVNSVIRLG